MSKKPKMARRQLFAQEPDSDDSFNPNMIKYTLPQTISDMYQTSQELVVSLIDDHYNRDLLRVRSDTTLSEIMEAWRYRYPDSGRFYLMSKGERITDREGEGMTLGMLARTGAIDLEHMTFEVVYV